MIFKFLLQISSPFFPPTWGSGVGGCESGGIVILSFNSDLTFSIKTLFQILVLDPRSQNEISFITRVAGYVHPVLTTYTWPCCLLL